MRVTGQRKSSAGADDIRPRLQLLAWVAAGLIGIAQVAHAHHSFAMFDQSKRVELKGTVHEFQWTNPHAYIELNVPNAAGGIDLWKIELNSPNNLKRQGWKSADIRPGDRVTVVINPLRDGNKGGLFVTVTLPDGRVLGDATRHSKTPANVPVVN